MSKGKEGFVEKLFKEASKYAPKHVPEAGDGWLKFTLPISMTLGFFTGIYIREIEDANRKKRLLGFSSKVKDLECRGVLGSKL